MTIVDALSKLGFSFWQIVVFFVILIFRKELKEIVQRIASVKVAGSEISWNQKKDPVETLTSLKSEIENSDRSKTDVVELIDSKIHNRLILATANIKSGTTYLWPALLRSQDHLYPRQFAKKHLIASSLILKHYKVQT